jgi:hypothetical protein
MSAGTTKRAKMRLLWNSSNGDLLQELLLTDLRSLSSALLLLETGHPFMWLEQRSAVRLIRDAWLTKWHGPARGGSETRPYPN